MQTKLINTVYDQNQKSAKAYGTTAIALFLLGLLLASLGMLSTALAILAATTMSCIAFGYKTLEQKKLKRKRIKNNDNHL